MPNPDRVNSGYVLNVNNRLIQFDCGGGISASFRRFDFDPLAVSDILISHTHPDHVSELPLFVQMRYLADRDGSRQTPLTIHVPDDVVDIMRDLFVAYYLIPGRLSFTYDIRPIVETEMISIGDATMTPLPNSHLAPYQEIIVEKSLPNKIMCYSWLIEIDGKMMIYSADLGSEDDIADYFEQLDALVIEAMHIDVERVVELALKAGVKMLILTHIPEGMDLKALLQIARKRGMDNVAVADDGMTIDLLQGTVSHRSR